MAANNNNTTLTPSAQPSTPLTRFSAIVPPRFSCASRPQIQITLYTIYEEETEVKFCQASSSSVSSALSYFRPLGSVKCS
ncbi:hypothetical protein E5676_scaffold480G00920 [Cucumis melo var. makuwa]|nr:hypothetical protein E6C27_scaffold318G00660 [Cucumis melo var. makuwa]TYK20698.1 hypothetical protein E5676_scaffold480G00920 [Cucumis melo var. makuwa]